MYCPVWIKQSVCPSSTAQGMHGVFLWCLLMDRKLHWLIMKMLPESYMSLRLYCFIAQIAQVEQPQLIEMIQAKWVI